MSSPITVDPDRASREESYLQHGSSFVDRLRTRLVQREILKRLPQTSGLRVLDLGCGYHATYLKAIGKRLAEGVGVDFHVSEERDRKSTRLNSSHLGISYAVFCLKKKNMISLELESVPSLCVILRGARP